MRVREQVAHTVAIWAALVALGALQLLIALPTFASLLLSPPLRFLSLSDADAAHLRIVEPANSTLWQSFLLPLDLLLPCQVTTADMQLITDFQFVSSIKAEKILISCSAITQPPGLALFVNSSDSAHSFWRIRPLIAFCLHSTSSRLGDAINGTAYCSSIVDINRHCAPLHLSYDGTHLILHICNSNVSVNRSSIACGLPPQTVDLVEHGVCGLPGGACIMCGICNQSLSKNEYEYECSCPHTSSNFTVDLQLILPLNKFDLRQGCRFVHLGNCMRSQSTALMTNSSQVGTNSFANLLIKYVGSLKVQSIQAGSLSKAGNKRYLIISIGSTLAGLLLLGVSIGLLCVCCKKRRKFRVLRDEASYPSTFSDQQIVHFTYAQLQEVSADFKCKLGVDGFGSVYKGTLFNGSFVAIKQLENAIRGEKEFAFQIAFFHSLNHPNLVRIRGFCANDSRRLLVSEYMVHGSLDAWIFHKPINKLEDKSGQSLSSPAFLDWNARFRIALDVAKGLAFLHQSNLIHLDVKPQNILLDDEFTAKLSDYGLSRLMDQEEGFLIMHMRGATGYMAPEWLQHACATEKSDVYSYGMVLMEMLGGRKNVDLSRERKSWYLPSVAANMYKEGKLLEVLDEKLTKSRMGEAQCEQAKRLMQIAFWCILENPTKRPDMGSLLLMLQGHKEVPEPPLPSYFSGLNAHASLSNHDGNHDYNQHSLHYYNQSGSSSPSCFNISFAPEPSSAMAVPYDVWSMRDGSGQHDDCSLLLPSQDNSV